MKNWLLKNVLRRRSALATCGAYIRYRQAPGRGGLTFGEFTFSSADVEEVLSEHLAENPHLLRDQDGAIFNWVKARDDGIAAPSSVPESWWRFQFIADTLLETGRGEVHCLKCNAKVSQSQLPNAENQARGSWAFNTLKCPEGHTLLDVETLHYRVRR